MHHYNITAEINRRDFDNSDATDTIIDSLPGYSAAIAQSEHGWMEITLTIAADHLRQAVHMAAVLIDSATDADLISIQAMATDEWDKRQGLEPMPELVSVTQAAEILGVTRQAVMDRINRKTLPASKVGREYVIQRAVLNA